MAGITGEALIAVEWLLICISLLLLIARLNLRLNLLGRGLLLSDYFVIAAFLAAVTLAGFDIKFFEWNVYQSDYLFDLSNYFAPEEEVVKVLKLFYFAYYPFYIEQYLNKASLLTLYYEIFPPDSRSLRLCLNILSLYCAASCIITLCVISLSCPWGCYWSLDSPCLAECSIINDNLGWALHFTSDICIFLLPLVYINRTKLTRNQKISASVTFCIGFANLSVTLSRWFVVQAVFTPVPYLTTAESLATSDGHSGLIVAILVSLRPYLSIWKGADLSSRPREISRKSGAELMKEASNLRSISLRSSSA